ncbi:hypothetical protein NSU_2334 [Novosphingobium pentaromativorans US6-1]|uniref:Enoyl reductase (ER) domain-containing protein n=1 Tax=Novosphingobium pentaromativorans US6-1 TaxID=1088721 RepID=G6EDB3_9SPHN|nr:hypothetical protein NSU_2334 [Novosphingobium pentaromativorans US6-1]
MHEVRIKTFENWEKTKVSGYQRIIARSFGGPEVLEIEDMAALPEPGEGEVRLRVEAAGVGFTDTILRRGRYVAYKGGLPLIPGYDSVGIVEAVGAGVSESWMGKRVADMPVSGSYSQVLIRPAETLVPVPGGVAPEAAVEVPLMWVTAWQMLTRCVDLSAGDAVLVVGASGSTGRALVQLSRHLGLRVVGTASAGKLDLVKSLGADPIDYRSDDLANAIRQASGGGVAAAFDAISAESWQTSWDSLAKGGRLVAYGFQEFIDGEKPAEEAMKSQKLLTVEWPAQGQRDGTGRDTVFYNIQERRESHPEDYMEDAKHLLGLIASGKVVPPPAETLPLSAAAEAHRRIASGDSERRMVLQPNG